MISHETRYARRVSFAESAMQTVARGGLALSRRFYTDALPKNDRGETLDAHIAAIIRLAARRPPLSSYPVGRARIEMDGANRMTDVPYVALPRVTDRTIDGPHGAIPIRVYTPNERARDQPMLVWFHGGGFVIGSLDGYDRLLRHLAHRAGVVVVSVDYRLGPEHRFPIPFEDSVAAAQWALANASSLGVDPHRVALGGDSAGGSLTASVSLALRDAHRRDPKSPMPRMQLLVYPATDVRRGSASHRTLGEGYLLTRELIAWFMERYLRSKADELDWRASPLLASDHGDLPAAWITVAGFDPLRDEGEQYAEKLRASGGRVEMRYEPSLIHGFFTMGGLVPAAAECVDAAARALSAGLAR
jgi:acetyl esterase